MSLQTPTFSPAPPRLEDPARPPHAPPRVACDYTRTMPLRRALVGLLIGLLVACAKQPPPPRPEPVYTLVHGCTEHLRATKRNNRSLYCARLPTARLGLSVLAWTSVGDRDGDGYDDDADCCPDLPEDFDSCADDDGCPECDDDGDGVDDQDLERSEPHHDTRWRRKPDVNPDGLCAASGRPPERPDAPDLAPPTVPLE